MCAAISENSVSTHLPHIGPYNTQLLLAFLNTLHRDLTPEQERGLVRPYLPNYVWDNVSFHRTNIVRDWFAAHERITVELLSPYSPFLNPIEEYFSAWRWKVYDHRPQDQMSLLDAMNAACEDITADHCRGLVRYSRRFFPSAWQWKTSDVMLMKIFGLTNKSDRMSTKNNFVSWMLFCIFVYLW